MALLRNPAAPFLTICAYANLKSQIFLTSSDAWSRNSQSKSSSASVFFVPYIQTEKQTLSVLPSKYTSYLSVPLRVHRRHPCPRTWNARPRLQNHILTVATAAPPCPATAMPLRLSPGHNGVFVALVAVPAHAESQLLVDHLVSPA